MDIEALWLTQQGTRTSDNRDHAGFGMRQNEFLGVVVDGSTNGAANGGYARAIDQMLVDWFVETAEAITADLMVNVLRQSHENLREQFPRGSASVLLIHATGRNSITIFHSGDCVLGEFDTNDVIAWQTSPHTLTNALAEMPLKVIAQSPTRHLLTKSFRSRAFEPPDILERNEFSGTLLLASDGFWAELPEKDQAKFLAGEQSSAETDRDDRSVLRLRISFSDHLVFAMRDKSSKNLYLRTQP
ncbi:hypothetical protein [Ensifer canadensis]